jgi:23S rRNA (cytidine1920-2'-O)/16S rRNA (cytidine1409-2'-O)-methyltransferase
VEAPGANALVLAAPQTPRSTLPPKFHVTNAKRELTYPRHPTLMTPATTNPTKKAKPGKTRLDVLLVERSLAPSRERAQALLLAGNVLVNGQKITKPGTQVPHDAKLEIIGEPQKYVSRGGLKLEGALQDFAISPAGKICMDVGSSTGGFTDCLLQNGAAQVYAVDVSIDQLDWKLRQDPRVVKIEKNARYLKPEDVPQSPDATAPTDTTMPVFVTMDVSFISVSKVLPAVVPVAAPNADFLILIKPQFELERGEIGKGGIVKDDALHQKAIARVEAAARASTLHLLGVKPSHLPGTEGNQEFFLHARKSAQVQ